MNKKLKKKLDKIGEHSSVGEELLMGVSELELQCAAVKHAVEDKYFTLEKALESFKVSKSDYDNYVNKKLWK